MELLKKYDGSLRTLATLTVDDLRKIKGIGRDKAVTLMAAFWTKRTSRRGWNWNCSCAKRVLNRWNFAETNPARGAAQKSDSVDDFNRAGSFSARFNINGNLHPASRRRNFQRFQVRLHQTKRHLRHGLTVGDRSLSARFLRNFQRIHFSSHDAFCRNSCARKIRFTPRIY